MNDLSFAECQRQFRAEVKGLEAQGAPGKDLFLALGEHIGRLLHAQAGLIARLQDPSSPTCSTCEGRGELLAYALRDDTTAKMPDLKREPIVVRCHCCGGTGGHA